MKNIKNKIIIDTDTGISEKMNEFLDKVDKLCWEYGYEIHASKQGWTGYDTTPKLAIFGDNEIYEVWFIDGDGRGK